ncbi:MAG: 4Fe-4S dicluster domain-containing protein [Desulfobacterales bacterium]
MKPKALVWIRRIAQTIFLLFFLFLLVESRLPLDIYVDYSVAMGSEEDIRLGYPVTFFFQINPLAMLTTLISGHQWIKGFGWAIGLLILTVFLGRIFCGFICPFGTLNHIVSSVKPSLKGRAMMEANTKDPSQRFKYFMLFAFILSAALGLNYVGFFDPIALMFRSLSLAILPGIGIGIKELFDLMARSDISVLRLASYGAEEFVSPIFGFGYPAYKAAWLIGGIFLGIVFLNRIKPRFWCRVLCPLGALLGIFSRFSLLKLEKDTERCTHCNRCMENCQGAASPKPDQPWENSECVTCFNCADACPENAIDFHLKWSLGNSRPPDIGRRAVLGSLTAGIAFPLLGKLDGQIHGTPDSRLIRPPGSLPEKEFLKLCQRCGLCMKVCPTNAINPALTEGGMAGFWTPNLIMINGYCEYSCTLCGTVCPTGAIKEISGKEKLDRPIRIGSAYLDRGRCLPWSGNTPCIMCEEICPTSPKAVYLEKSTVTRPNGERLDVQLPYVDLKHCVGCGICETKCPVKGRPAIRILSAGETRSKKNQILLGI